jgi:hypothetical protein
VRILRTPPGAQRSPASRRAHCGEATHGGSEDTDNLALACHRCNLQKGPNLTGIDPETGQIVRLFHPRRDRWSDHFRHEYARIDGLTAIGRATVRVLDLNDARRLELRAEILRSDG